MNQKEFPHQTVMDKHLIGWKSQTTNPKVAGYRVRCIMLIDELRKIGYNIEPFDPNHRDKYSIVIYGKSFSDNDYKEAKDLKEKGTKIVFDIFDNLMYDRKESPGREKIRSQIRNMIKLADAITVPSQQLKELLWVPDSSKTPIVIEDILEYEQHKPVNRAGDTTRLVWHGNAGSPNAQCGMSDINRVKSLLHNINTRHKLELTIISNNRGLYEEISSDWEFPVHYEEWEKGKFAELFRQNDICILPITRNPFTICKNHSRLATSLLLGLPVVADSIPAYKQFSPCAYLDNWEEGLINYINNPRLREKHVLRGQEIIREQWQSKNIIRKWHDLFQSIARKKALIA